MTKRYRRKTNDYSRPQTFREWSNMATCGLTPPDNRSEFRKIRELLREGKMRDLWEHQA